VKSEKIKMLAAKLDAKTLGEAIEKAVDAYSPEEAKEEAKTTAE
jgi:hypothetical protein